MSVPRPGQYGEPWSVRTYPGYSPRLLRTQEAIEPRDDAVSEIAPEEPTNAPRIVACFNALNGRDPEALHELEAAAKAAERVMSCVSDAEEETRAALRLRAALKAFGAWS